MSLILIATDGTETGTTVDVSYANLTIEKTDI